MANKALALGAATVGGVMVYSGLAGVNVMDVLAGKASLKGANPKGGEGLPNVGGPGGTLGSKAPVAGNTPRGIIEEQVIPLARQHGINVTAESVANANAHHGPTITGGRSDHQGPGNERWAADMSNGNSPTPQMDALAADLARLFRIKWDGSGARSATWGGYRFQLIYKSLVGGNHYNHVHFGVARV